MEKTSEHAGQSEVSVTLQTKAKQVPVAGYWNKVQFPSSN